MNKELERKILLLALKRNLLPSGILEQFDREKSAMPVDSLLDSVVERGFLNRDTVDSLKEEISSSQEISTILPDSRQPTNPDPVFGHGTRISRCFGRYLELEFLGQGGMARVYKAFDPLRQEVSKGQAYLNKALQINSRLAEAYCIRSKLLLLLAHSTRDQSEKINLIKSSEQAFQEGLNINSNLAKKCSSLQQ
jgi:hypothetical protein